MENGKIEFLFLTVGLLIIGILLGMIIKKGPDCPSTQELVKKEGEVHGKKVKVSKCIDKEE